MPIKIENLTHIYNKGLTYETVAIANVSFDIDDGDFVGIIGHTGSGKSTLIQHLNGLLKPDSGSIFIGDLDITDKKVTMTEIRKKIGLVFQYPEYQLFEETVAMDVAFGPKNLGLSEDEIDVRVREAMSLVGLPFDEFAFRSPFELSGGQKRRVAIAGVIAMKPEVLILDEPTAGLDPKAHKDILNMILSVKDRTGSTVILVSHNMDDIAELANKVLIMDAGRVVKYGSPMDVFADGEYLRSIGLGLPFGKALAEELKASGFNLNTDILLLDDLENAIYEGWQANILNTMYKEKKHTEVRDKADGRGYTND
jgi:energy-coupling factor transport system ATP-binding protein